MATKQIATLSGLLTGDDAVSGSSAVVRDASGNIYVNELNTTKVINTGPETVAITATTGTYTQLATDRYITADAAGGAYSITLLAAAACTGKALWVTRINSGANAVTIDGNASETINGATTLVLSAQWQCALLVCDGSNWIAFLGYSTGINGSITMADASNIVLNTTTGTKIGTAVGQKLGFWNVTPVVQPAAAAQAALTDNSGGSATDTIAVIGATYAQAEVANAVASLAAKITAIRTALVATGIMKGAA